MAVCPTTAKTTLRIELDRMGSGPRDDLFAKFGRMPQPSGARQRSTSCYLRRCAHLPYILHVRADADISTTRWNWSYPPKRGIMRKLVEVAFLADVTQDAPVN